MIEMPNHFLSSWLAVKQIKKKKKIHPIAKFHTFMSKLRLCLVTVFVFYFEKLVFGNIKKKQFSSIFEIKNMFG